MKVLLVDDHPLVLSALQAVIQNIGSDTTVVGVDSAAAARATLADDSDFDLVLLDLALGDADGFDVLVEFRAAYPAVPVVVVSASDRASDVIRAIDSGAMGFVPKKSSHGELHAALEMVMTGSMYVPPSMLGLEFGRSVAVGGDTVPGAVDAFVAELRRSPPDVVLSMGVSHFKAQVEERPENHLGANPDGNDVMMREREVRAGGPKELKTDLPVEVITDALVPFGGSRVVGTSKNDVDYTPDRSAYLCNYLGYNLATEFGATPTTTAGFMHITPETPVDQMHAVLQAVTARQLEDRRAQPAPRS
jgi:DNA-binding response OmpR family regulator